jgi:hypothetical protein
MVDAACQHNRWPNLDPPLNGDHAIMHTSGAKSGGCIEQEGCAEIDGRYDSNLKCAASPPPIPELAQKTSKQSPPQNPDRCDPTPSSQEVGQSEILPLCFLGGFTNLSRDFDQTLVSRMLNNQNRCNDSLPGNAETDINTVRVQSFVSRNHPVQFRILSQHPGGGVDDQVGIRDGCAGLFHAPLKGNGA